MYKQAPSRNNRSKGIKVKHILQICVLIAVCFWLLYQVKHSHEKRKEFESKDETIMEKLRSDSELQRFGRKDIPRVTEIATNFEKHGQDDDDDDKDDDKEDDKEDEEERENKNGEDEIEREEGRVGENEEERGGGDDEIDENEPEKTEEEEVDEDKEREENHNENEEHDEEGHLDEEEEEESGKEGHTEAEESDDIDKEDHGEREITSDDHDQKVERNNRKAQEELYRGDDASSEVAHNVQSFIQENGNFTSGRANEIYGKINFGHEHEMNISQESVKPEVHPREHVNSTADDSSLQNSTLPQIHNNSTNVSDKLNNNLISNEIRTTFDGNLSKNGTIGSKQDIEDKNEQKAGEDPKSENVNTNKTLALLDARNDNETMKNGKDSLVSDGSEYKKPENIVKDGRDENSESHTSEGKEAIQHDPIDVSDTGMLTQEERESRTDSDMPRDIKNEVHGSRDVVVE